jgi:hypothetical protein
MHVAVVVAAVALGVGEEVCSTPLFCRNLPHVTIQATEAEAMAAEEVGAEAEAAIMEAGAAAAAEATAAAATEVAATEANTNRLIRLINKVSLVVVPAAARSD